METLFALVLIISMTNGDYQEAVIGIYDTEMQCQQAAIEQHITAECYPVEDVIHMGEQPAKEQAQF